MGEVKLMNIKERIISLLNLKGPSLPIPLARTVGVSTLYISAFLSELYSEKKVKMSNMKVGSSSLYFLEGQESQLENFVEYLNNMEKEAFFLLKENNYLDDDLQSPAIRVALRAIKDFAIPIRVGVDGNDKIFWKYYLLNESDFQKLIEKDYDKGQDDTPEKDTSESEENKETDEWVEIKDDENNKFEVGSNMRLKEIEKETDEVQKNVSEREINKKFESPLEPVKSPILEYDNTFKKNKKKDKKPEGPKISESVKVYLNKKNFRIVKEILDKKKEYIAIVEGKDMFGNQKYYLIVKDKKKINENDITIALQKSQAEKMPSLLMCPGDIDKKAESSFKEWGNLVKFDRL